jgi:hypothetical protein
MSKRPSLDTIVSAETSPEKSPESPVMPATPTMPPPLPLKRRKRKPKAPAHTSLYISAAVRKTLRELAMAYGVSQQTLLLQGVDMMLKAYGRRSIEEHGDD